MRELETRCRRLSVTPDSIDALLVTHEHGDHIKGVGPLARKYRMPVWMTQGTSRRASCGDIPDLNLFRSHAKPFAIGAIEVRPYAVPHDSAEPCQFVFRHRRLQLGLLTDAGSITPHVVDTLAELDALLLECNHDSEMLQNGPYPPYLQARVGGDYGHLNNQQAARLLTRIDRSRLQHLVIGHISEKNNHPELALAALAQVDTGLQSRMTLLNQHSVSGWFELRADALLSAVG